MAQLFRIDGTPGPSTFGSQVDFYYDRPSDGADSLYPSIYIADALDVVSSQFVLDSASPADWQTCGMWMNPLGATAGGGSGGYAASHFLNLSRTAGRFYMEALFHPTTQSLADNSYAPLIWLTDPVGAEIFGVFVGGTDGATPYLEVYRQKYFADPYSVWWSSLNPDFSAAGHLPVAGSPYKVRLEWECATHDGANHGTDGWWNLYINDALVTGQTNFRMYLSVSTTPKDMVGWAAVGFDGTIGPWDYLEIGSLAAPVPPMQRAGYVLFSKDIVEKQVQVNLTRTALQILVADPPASGTPVVLPLTQVTGNLYDQEGNTISSGQLVIKPRAPITVSGELVATNIVRYTITGLIDLNLAPSNNGVLYDVQYDPDPDDTVTPINLKSGYWRAVWEVPDVASVDIADL